MGSNYREAEASSLEAKYKIALAALHAVVDVENSSLWADDREDAADAMVEIANNALAKLNQEHLHVERKPSAGLT